MLTVEQYELYFGSSNLEGLRSTLAVISIYNKTEMVQ